MVINYGINLVTFFRVKKGVRVPPSLKNIYKELAKEYDDFEIPEHGYLSKWAEQGS